MVLDPEQLTYAQWFWVVFAIVVAIMFACRCISLYYPDEPITDEPQQTQVERPALAPQQTVIPAPGR